MVATESGMVDFNNLGTPGRQSAEQDPIKLFRALPRPPGINDLYASQAEVLTEWYGRMQQGNLRDVVVKLHTGGGKTLVGLLIAKSLSNSTRKPILYLTPTTQLVQQTLAQAAAHGISAVSYAPGGGLPEQFRNANAIMIGTYKALFNGKTPFGTRGTALPLALGAIVLDDAHAAFSIVRDTFTVALTAEKHRGVYEDLISLFRPSFRELGRLGTFDEIVAGCDNGVIEIPYWAWLQKLDAVRAHLAKVATEFPFEWPLVRDRLEQCHALIGRQMLTITPILPAVVDFPSFAEAPHRVFMSATMGDDSEIVRTFDVAAEALKAPLTSESFAGIGERLILCPPALSYKCDVDALIREVIRSATGAGMGTVILSPSKKVAERWQDVADVVIGTATLGAAVEDLRAGRVSRAKVLVNRYDGVDLPGNSCRVLVFDGLPFGVSEYETFRATVLTSGATLGRLVAQRIEQGMGRGARGGGDHCVVLLISPSLAGWVSRQENFEYLTTATRTQLDMGVLVTSQIKTDRELHETIAKCLNRASDWVGYHARELGQKLASSSDTTTSPADLAVGGAVAERRALRHWESNSPQKAIDVLEKAAAVLTSAEPQYAGWMLQLAARIAHAWGNSELSSTFQQRAHGVNRNLHRPQTTPPYIAQSSVGHQAQTIVAALSEYRLRRGMLSRFDELAVDLQPAASSSVFERALESLGKLVGFHAERWDINGVGPDVLWLLPPSVGYVIEAKSRKQQAKALTKAEHGQVLVAHEWFKNNYPNWTCVRVIVHPAETATTAAAAAGSYVLTYEKLAELVNETRGLYNQLIESQLPYGDLATRCAQLLSTSPISSERFASHYLKPFSLAQG